MTRSTFARALAAMAILGMLSRLGYVGWQAAHDPTFSRPALDGAVYVAWARALATGRGEPPGAFYLAPLFPHLLTALFALFGESWALLYGIQQALVVGAACLLALTVRERVGEAAALLTAALALLYHPTAFFASRPIGEPVALLLAAAGVYAASRAAPAAWGLAGLAFGFSSLARPNMLLIPAGLTIAALLARRRRDALLLAAVTAVTLAPVALRNLAASGHPVLVSSNGGITLFHGNGPGALGIYTPAEGFSGSLAGQRDEATALASARAGVKLDPVDADRWWGRQALKTRWADPLGTVSLLARRAALTLDTYEHGLDDAPELDANPWRRAFPAPLFAILGLAVAGVAALGFRGTGGALAWIPIAASALTPVAFYVSSRYRLPMAFFLCVPAGAGAAALIGLARSAPSRSRIVRAAALGAVVAAASAAVPSGPLARTEEAAAHANRSSVFAEARDWTRAEAEARRALALDASSVLARYNLAVVVEAEGRVRDAESLYREALRLDPGHAESAGNLSKLLVEGGRAGEAVPILERALASRPGDPPCWTNLIVAYLSTGDRKRAQRALDDGTRAGVTFAPELVEAVRTGAP